MVIAYPRLTYLTLSCLLLFIAACTQPNQDAIGWLASGALAGTADVPANGAVQARALPDGTFLVTIQLNIPQADQGSSYVVELHNEKGNVERVGVLQAPADNVRHVGEFIVTRDIRAFLDVSVARHRRSGSSTVVATGTLRPVAPRL